MAYTVARLTAEIGTMAVWRSGQAARYTCTEVTQHTATNAQTIALGLPVRVQITPVDKAMLVEISPQL